jgi:hypothetical protein
MLWPGSKQPLDMTDLLEEFMFMFLVLINYSWEQIFALHTVVIVCKNGNILRTNFFPFEFVCTPTARAVNEYAVRVLGLYARDFGLYEGSCLRLLL